MDFAITITDKEMRRALGDIQNYGSATAKEIQGVITRSTYRVGARARQNAPSKFGRLRQSVREKVGKLMGEISVNVDYAGAVEFGTKPHIIKPKRKKALAFKPGAGFKFWDESGRVVVKSVKHPGTDPQPYLRPALEAEVGHMTQALKKVIEDAAKGGAR